MGVKTKKIVKKAASAPGKTSSKAPPKSAIKAGAKSASKIQAKAPIKSIQAKPQKNKAPTKAAAGKASAKSKSSIASAPKTQAKKIEAKKAAPKLSAPKLSAKDERKQKAMAALQAAMKESESPEEDEEFDPEAFFAAQAAAGVNLSDLRPHVMRKERVDMNLMVRYRLPEKGPLVFPAELVNLSKGGLSLRTKEYLAPQKQIRLEIPLPHTSELFAIQVEAIWSAKLEGEHHNPRFPHNIGFKFLPMSLAKQAVISSFIQSRRDEIIMAKIGLDRFTEAEAELENDGEASTESIE